jgi:hypothetical protein
LILSLRPDAHVDTVLDWLWPPGLLVLVVWMFLRARRDLHSRARGLALYPVLAVLAVFELGGAYQTVGASLDSRAVANETRVCVYDRLGRGHSDPVSGAQDGTQIATDLHTLLHRGTYRVPTFWRDTRSAACTW